MEITTTTITRNPARHAAVNGLAIVGFLALLVAGIALAIYSARYVPKTVSRIGAAAVSLSSVFTHAVKPGLAVITTIPFGTGVASTSAATTTSLVAVAATTTPVTVAPAAPVVVRTTPVVTAPPAPYGLPDLATSIDSVGYLTTNSTDSYVPSATIPSGDQGAVKFTVANIGTNVSGAWYFTANLPTNPSFTYTSPIQSGMNPGDRIEFTLGFDRPQTGSTGTITITADSSNIVQESNEGNNSASQAITIQN